MNYIIYSPPYRKNSGGIVVLHTLGKKLKQAGNNVFMLSGKSVDGLPTIDLNEANKIKEQCWVIYPEIVEGNPLNATNVIRWVLNSPGYIGGNSDTWADTDLVYCLWDYFELDSKINTEGYLRVFDFNLDFFTNEGRERTIDSHLFRKSKNRKGSPTDILFDKHSNESICIDGKIAGNFDLLKETLNKTNLFISYDTATYYSTIAALCGATSIVIPDRKTSKEEWISKLPINKYGIAWGLEDIEWAVQTKDKVRDYLIEFEKECDELLDEFIANTTGKFKSLKQFWRTYNNKLYAAGSVYELGFSIDKPSYIPHQYLKNQEFIILRTCFGVGDWGIISAFPRKLKEKYPNCKVHIPSPKLLREMFGNLESNWSSWSDPFQVVHTIFDNNPYVDGFIDSFEGEVYNDHFKIFEEGVEEPLLKQIMRFWQFDSFDDIEPELYWTEEEIKEGNEIISKYSDGKFGTLLLSNRYKNEGRKAIQSKLDEYNLPMFYWTSNPNHGFNFKPALNMNEVDTKVQLYIKSQAVFNVGNQTGMNDTIANYTPTYTVPRGRLGSNIIKSQIYI